MYSCGFVMDCQRGRLLGTYFYVIDIFYDKTQFTCLLFVIIFHMEHITCLLSAYKKDRYEAKTHFQYVS